MFYGLHTTTKAERDILLTQKAGCIRIKPEAFQATNPKPIVCEEGTGRFYEHEWLEFHDLLREIEKDPTYDYTQSAYFKTWIKNGPDIHTRLKNLPGLFKSIKELGVLEPVHCEVTGERLDGSFRTKIALYLGYTPVCGMLHRFKWTDISEDFIERKLKARWLSSGKDYYEFEYGYKDWKNIPEGGDVYRENAERAEMICGLVTGQKVLDLGCNEGYISIQLARRGHEVVGIDNDLIHIAWLNKLIFEFIDKKDLPIVFHEFDLNKHHLFGDHDTVLFLNVLYHLDRDAQKKLLKRYKGKQMIFQCNLRKESERGKYYTSHPDDLGSLLTELGIAYKVIEWRDKPLIVTE